MTPCARCSHDARRRLGAEEDWAPAPQPKSGSE